MTTVRPSCFHSSRTSSSHTWLRGSRALVGSSSSRTRGCMATIAAMATRFFSPPESEYGGRSRSFSMRRCAATSVTSCRTSSSGEAQLQRAEGELVAHVGAEELHVGVLEDEADAGAEVAAERRVLERLLGERRAEGDDLAGAGEDEAVEHLEQRRLARAVGADDGDVLAGRDGEVEAGQRGLARRYSWQTPRRTKSGVVGHAVILSAASASAHSATLAASQAQSPGRRAAGGATASRRCSRGRAWRRRRRRRSSSTCAPRRPCAR